MPLLNDHLSPSPMTTYGGNMFTKKKSHDDLAENKPSDKTEYPTAAAKAAINSAASHNKPNATASPFPLKGAETPSTTPSRVAGSRLHVGKDIHLKGEITACDRLIVEGKVEASMNSNEIEISESGVFAGEVNIDRADISGIFEGKMTARTHLIIRKTGRVSGDIKYTEIEIEPGGEILGNLQKGGTSSPKSKTDLSDDYTIPVDTAKDGSTFLQ